MVKRFQYILIYLILAIFILSSYINATTYNDYTSPYYSDTINLKEIRIIDQLYEYGLMEGILSPQEDKQGIFAPEDGITQQQFYILINNLMDIELVWPEETKIINHSTARNIFIQGLRKKNLEINLKNYEVPNDDKENMTRLETAKLIYSYLQYQNLIPLNYQIVDFAFEYIGSKYVWGGSSPKGFDCSGFTKYIMKHFNISIGRTCNAQYKAGTHIELEDLEPGDILIFERTYAASGYTHVGLYVGNNYFIHAANSRKGVIISSLLEDYYADRFVCGVRTWEQPEDQLD